MRKLKNWTIAVLVLAIICPLLVVPASAADDAAEKHIHSLSAAGVCTACGMNVISLLNTAYIYSFPLVLMDVTDEKVTNTETATYTQAPVNQFVHVPAFADANAKDIVLPNEGL